MPHAWCEAPSFDCEHNNLLKGIEKELFVKIERERERGIYLASSFAWFKKRPSVPLVSYVTLYSDRNMDISSCICSNRKVSDVAIYYAFKRVSSATITYDVANIRRI